MEVFGFIVLALILAGVFRLIAGGMDSGRVEDYLRQRGGKLLSASWEPFGKGWLGEENDRIYRVRYLDSAGNERSASCKTSMWSGVYFTDDQVVQPAPSPVNASPMAALLEAPPLPPGQFRIRGLDHVQLAMPAGQEEVARQFFRDVLGLAEVPKPANLAARGGVWFTGGALHLHLGVEPDFRPARKAHPALLVENLQALIARLELEGLAVITDEPLEGYRRVYVADPFGNRIELLEPD